MKKFWRFLSVALSATLVLGCTGVVNAAPEKSINAVNVNKDTTTGADVNDLLNMLNKEDADKEETVYVIAGANGEVKKIIVSELLKNKTDASVLNDSTTLSDITNVKSDAAYKLDGTSCVWDAAGEDIYYRGTTDKELPVLFDITFTLDGKTVTAEEIKGASGKVTMTFNYRNNCKDTVEIDGKEETIYVPFVMLSGMILNNENFKHVTVSSGKVITDGDKTIVLGLAMPGLKENLKLDDETIDIPSEVTITADVTDFSLATTLSVATNEIFSGLNINGTGDIDGLSEKLVLLEESTKKLVDGSSELYGYLNELLSKVKELKEAVKTLTGYSDQISSSVDKLYNEAVKPIGTKLEELNSGLAEISSNSEALRTGAKQVFESLLKSAKDQIAQAGLSALGVNTPNLTIDNYETELNKIIAQLSDTNVKAAVTTVAKTQITAAVEAASSQIEAAVTQTVRETYVKPQVLASLGISDYTSLSDAQKASVDAAIDAQMQTATVKATISTNVKNTKEQKIQENLNEQITTALAKAAAGRTALEAAKTSLNSYKTFYVGVIGYTQGTDQAASGSGILSQAYNENITANMAELNIKLKEFAAGMTSLNDKMPELESGVSQITEGAKTLSEGEAEYYETGIKGLLSKVGNIEPLITRLKATIDVSKEYQSYAGIAKDMTGNVKFIYRTEAIE